MADHKLRVVASNEAVAPARCRKCAILHRAVCGALTDEELTTFDQIARPRHVQAGQVIMSEAKPPDIFANIVSGVVKLTKMLPDGRQQIVCLQFASDFLGRIYGPQKPYFAEAVTDVELCCFPQAEFLRMLRDCPDLERRLFENTLDELDAARDWMVLLGRKNAKEKVASFLELIAKRTSNIGCVHSEPADIVEFSLPLTRADIADHLGLTLETVSRQISQLKTEGIITVAAGSRAITVPDMDALAKATEQHQ